MLFTRTLRRKLMVSVGLVLVMLLILSVSGISGLSSYRSVIRDLDHSLNQAPQRNDLVAAVAALAVPLSADTSLRRHGAEEQYDAFKLRLAEARTQLDEYRRRLDEMPIAQGKVSQSPLTEPLLDRIAYRLKTSTPDERGLDDWNERLRDPQTRPEALENMQFIVGDALRAALNVPDPVEGLSRTLTKARNVYRSSLVVVSVASGVVLILFGSLLRSGYAWIFHPIRQLHQGARRVANGDFDYRVQLKTKDEMAELAHAFNQMTARFQEIRANLDNQVQERSRQLVRSERLAGVGFLAAGVAHEINNPLSAIAMAAESLEGRFEELLARGATPEADVIRQYLQMIQNESFRCKQITERLLDFSRGRDAVREMTDLTHVVSEVVAMVRYLSKYRDKQIEFPQSAACFAEVNGPEIKQVVLNLVANGLEAMDPGGTLHVSITDQTDHVLLEFRDEGCGMTAEVMENMFEPFFTRKQNGQGTGLGLSISHRIVTQHGGTLSAKSPGPGEGSTFSVRLPRRAAQSAAA